MRRNAQFFYPAISNFLEYLCYNRLENRFLVIFFILAFVSNTGAGIFLCASNATQIHFCHE